MKFQHPHVVSGSLVHEDGTFDIEDGVLDCPDHVGHSQGFKPLDDAAAADRKLATLKVLEGTVGEVEKALDGPVEGTPLTVDELVALAAAEQAGKNRKGVLELLTLHREAFVAPGTTPAS